MNRIVIACLFVFAIDVAAQASSKTMAVCKTRTREIARIIFKEPRDDASLKRLLRELVSTQTDSWAEGVVNYMVISAIDAPRMTEHEIATLGYAYCLERRPAGS